MLLNSSTRYPHTNTTESQPPRSKLSVFISFIVALSMLIHHIGSYASSPSEISPSPASGMLTSTPFTVIPSLIGIIR